MLAGRHVVPDVEHASDAVADAKRHGRAAALAGGVQLWPFDEQLRQPLAHDWPACFQDLALDRNVAGGALGELGVHVPVVDVDCVPGGRVLAGVVIEVEDGPVDVDGVGGGLGRVAHDLFQGVGFVQGGRGVDQHFGEPVPSPLFGNEQRCLDRDLGLTGQYLEDRHLFVAESIRSKPNQLQRADGTARNDERHQQAPSRAILQIEPHRVVGLGQAAEAFVGGRDRGGG